MSAVPSWSPPDGDDAALLEALKAEHPNAAAALYDRFEGLVHRLLWQLLGADTEHDDLVQQAFMAIFKGVRRVRDSESLKSWVVSVVINMVRTELRRRRWRRLVMPMEHLPDTALTNDDHEAADALRRVYQLLRSFPPDEQIVFALRYIDDKQLEDVAKACACSLATAKRRLEKAERRFTRLAAREPSMLERLQRSERWEQP